MKGFRRGVTTEIKRSGSTLAVILGIGGWRGPGYRHYIQLHEDEEECMRKLMSITDSGKESSDEDGIDSISHNVASASFA